MMRLLRRNLTPVYYCLFDHREQILDEDGNWTGEWDYIYKDPVREDMVQAPNRGYIHADFYGRMDSYDKTLVCANMDCPIDEETMLYINKEPEYDANGRPINFNYSVRNVAPGINTIRYFVMGVQVGKADE